jgi:hypothetical protein
VEAQGYGKDRRTRKKLDPSQVVVLDLVQTHRPQRFAIVKSLVRPHILEENDP